MRTFTLLARNLTWYWRTNLAVLLGTATAAGVFGGALLVGDSVRATLRDLALARLGNAQYAVLGAGFFREELAAGLGNACPAIALEAVATHETSGRRAGGVEVYGVDERFWKFQGEPGEPPRERQALLTAALARELGSQPGDTLLLRVGKPSAIPRDSLHGQKEDASKTIRLSMSGIGHEFSLRLQQGDVRAVYVPLARLQRELNRAGRINAILTTTAPDLKDRYSLSDLGLKLRIPDERHCLSLESDSALIGDTLAEIASSTAASLGLRTEPVLAYLANSIRVGEREIPYSIVAALDAAPAPASADGIVLNEWAARDLSARAGQVCSLEYYIWKSDGRLRTENAQFRIEKIVPISGAAADRSLTPEYPGITGSLSLRDWDPPFPVNLGRIRPADEQYWKRYRTTPKAFVSIGRGRLLWGTRFGSLTSIRIYPPSEAYAAALRKAIDPSKMGLTVLPVRSQAIEASRGATDFGEYFIYFSFFLMISALLLAGLFFKLGVEQRQREIGVLRALGYSLSKIRAIFLAEGAVLAFAGGLVGMGAALGYGALILLGLRTWWFAAVGTRLLSLHASTSHLWPWEPPPGVAAGLGSAGWTLRGLQPVTPRGLMAGERQARPAGRLWLYGTISACAALALMGAAWAGRLGQTAGFFGAGTLLLIAALLMESAWLRSNSAGHVLGAVSLGIRSATYHPGRSILCIALIASATFLIVSVDAFRQDDSTSASGSFPLLAESAIPLIHDPNTPAGRFALNIPVLPGVEFVSFRLRPGDDASCLNLYRAHNPRILAPPASFVRAAGEKQPLWRLLDKPQPDGAVPAIADANSLEYVLHLKVGDELKLGRTRFCIVAALHDSLFQSELLISEANFLRLFPSVEGYRFFLLKAAPARAAEVTTMLEAALSDYGFDVQPTASRLASFHQVENTYLSTFRALGALGLVLGTIGLGAVLLRNVLERRRELALLRAVGYRRRHLAVMVLAENMLLLLAGLLTGTACALLAVAPAMSARGGHLPVLSLGVLLGGVLAAGIGASFAATFSTLRSPLLAALRSE